MKSLHCFRHNTNFFLLLIVVLLSHSGLVIAEPYAFITNQLDNSVSVIDTHSLKVIKELSVKGKPVGVAVNNATSQVYVSTPTGGGFAVLDGKKLEQTDFIKVGGASLGIATDAKGELVFVADWYENTVSVQFQLFAAKR